MSLKTGIRGRYLHAEIAESERILHLTEVPTLGHLAVQAGLRIRKLAWETIDKIVNEEMV